MYVAITSSSCNALQYIAGVLVNVAIAYAVKLATYYGL